MSTWIEHVARWRDCTACPLHTQRSNIVLARGTVPCDVLFIGEAPGASEDALGLPFKGPAGGVLDQIIERALPPAVTYAMTNLVACYPRDAKMRGDNEPEHVEILACRPRLEEFIALASPRLIVCVGSLSTGYVREDGETPIVSIIHPAATFPPRMARAQAGEALRRATVVLRNAVEDMLQSRVQ